MATVRFSGGRRVSRIEGIEETRRVFRQLSNEAIGRITNALNLGAAEIETLAKHLAPVDTGELRDAIETRSSLEGFNAAGAVGALRVGFRGDFRESGTAVRRFIGVFPESAGAPGWYAAFVEFGTAKRFKGARFETAGGRKKIARGTHPGTDAKPFLFPAFRVLRKRVVGRVNRELNRGFKEFARRQRLAA